MYLSRLILNPRCREVQRDLADCQNLHRTILSAFPQVERNGDGARSQFGVLYRMDVESSTGRLVLLVQSLARPDWSSLHSGYLTPDDEDNFACKPIAEFYDRLKPGMNLIFRLRANPTRKIDTRSGPDGKKRNGKRVELRTETEQIEWLRRRGENAGFRLLSVRAKKETPDVRTNVESKSLGWRAPTGRMTFGSVLFEGKLEITDAASFRETLAHGIGSAKSYGFGLFSIARVQELPQ